MKGKTVGLLGLAFKPNTDDLRDAPSLDIARALLSRGATVVVHDPVAMPRARAEHAGLGVRYCESAEQVAEHADAIVLVTEWQQYQDLDWAAMAKRAKVPFVLDGRHFLDVARMTRDGWKCTRISG